MPGAVLAVVVAVVLLVPAAAGAQGNFEIQVYGAETVAPGRTMIELHSNMAVLGTTRIIDGVRPTQHALHETLEITQGFTPWFETGFYLFTSVQPADGWEYVGNHIRPRLRIPESWKWPVGLGLSSEIGYQRRTYSTDRWTVELRPIIDAQRGRWYLSFNPTFERAIDGPDVKRGWEFTPAAKVGYEVTKKVSLGLEYYGAIGRLNDVDRPREQQHLLFAVLDLDLGENWEFNLGIGAGLTPATDSLIIKSIIGYRFDFLGGK
ncbi:MAG: transporter [Candidatus Rokubacteria bacterium]|nr:transporter [Candidatus Rokubacteria bacterium]MBI3826396.1 transporter [Candidatus Rokubacteria bacterium]